eukprot:1612585-Pyramimonas_sp.AAC.2
MGAFISMINSPVASMICNHALACRGQLVAHRNRYSQRCGRFSLRMSSGLFFWWSQTSTSVEARSSFRFRSPVTEDRKDNLAPPEVVGSYLLLKVGSYLERLRGLCSRKARLNEALDQLWFRAKRWLRLPGVRPD